MSETLRHFIWDFDGTLFDTYPVIIRNLRTALGQFGRDADPVQAMGLMLDCIPAAMKYYAETYQIPLEALNEAYQVCHRQANRELEAQPMAGVREVLTEIRDSGRYNYIFTHRKLEETRAYLAKYGMTDLFRDIMAPETPGFAWKPSPDGVLALMKEYGMKPEESVMVGDRECDLGSGRNAGIHTLHLMCPAVPEQLDCDWRIGSYAEMEPLLRKS